jgi:hypothetical protein
MVLLILFNLSDLVAPFESDLAEEESEPYCYCWMAEEVRVGHCTYVDIQKREGLLFIGELDTQLYHRLPLILPDCFPHGISKTTEGVILLLQWAGKNLDSHWASSDITQWGLERNSCYHRVYFSATTPTSLQLTRV